MENKQIWNNDKRHLESSHYNLNLLLNFSL